MTQNLKQNTVALVAYKTFRKINKAAAGILALTACAILLAVFFDFIHWMIGIKAVLMLFGLFGILHFLQKPMLYLSKSMRERSDLIPSGNLIVELLFVGLFLAIIIVACTI